MKKNPTIQELRKQNVKVFITHYRRSNTVGGCHKLKYFRDNRLQYDINNFGGKCETEIIKDEKSYKGVAFCNMVDNYNKKAGRVKSFGRAWSNLINNRPES